MVAHTLLTAEQCAERLGVSRSLIYKALADKKLVGYRIGCRGKGCWRVSEYDLMQWLETLRVSEKPPDDDGGRFNYL